MSSSPDDDTLELRANDLDKEIQKKFNPLHLSSFERQRGALDELYQIGIHQMEPNLDAGIPNRWKPHARTYINLRVPLPSIRSGTSSKRLRKSGCKSGS